MLRALFILWSFEFATSALAQVRLTEMVAGPHAFGTGGAFTAVADDSSAAAVNPAGLSRITAGGTDSTTNNVTRSQVYHHIANGDVTTNSTGLTTFLGGAKRFSSSTVLAGYIATPLAATRDEQYDDDFNGLDGLHETHDRIRYDFQYTEVGAGMGYQAAPETSRWGMGLAFFRYRQAGVSAIIMNSEPDPNAAQANAPKASRVLVANTNRSSLEAVGAKLVFGWLSTVTNDLSLGISVALVEALQSKTRSSTALLIIPLDEQGKPIASVDRSAISQNDSTAEAKNLAWPVILRSGIRYDVSPSVNFAADILWFGPATFSIGQMTTHKDPVFNGALGLNYSISPDWIWRTGIFSDRDATPDPSKTSEPQDIPHIDSYGFATQCAFALGHSMVALGISGQSGKGSGIAITDAVQDVTSIAHTESISISSAF